MHREANEKTVGQITHNSFQVHETSCDASSLRVKSEPFIGSVIDVDDVVEASECQIISFIQRRSHTELTTDSHSRSAHAEDHAPKQHGTQVSWGLVPAENPAGSPADAAAAFRAQGTKDTTVRRAKPSALAASLRNAGSVPAFSLRVISVGLPVARRAEFISVSGQCAARSALSSDMRIKRISGGVAATEHLRAPMNSPTGGFAAQRVFFHGS